MKQIEKINKVKKALEQVKKIEKKPSFFTRIFGTKNEKIVEKDILVEKLRKVAELMGDDINVGLRITKDKCEISAIYGTNFMKEMAGKQHMPATKEDMNYVG